MISSKHLPHLILGAMVGCAAVILGLGIHLARVEERQLIERDLTPLADFTKQLLDQMGELEARYESHLRQVAESSHSSVQLAELGRNVEGIQLGLILDAHGNQSAARIVEDSPELPPTFNLLAVRRGLFFADSAWLDQPGPSHYYAWLDDRRAQWVVLQIDPIAVRNAINRSLIEWLPEAFEPVRAGEIGARFLSGEKSMIETRPPETEAASASTLVLPITNRFGSWRIERSDAFTTVVRYRESVLIAASLSALGVATLGFLGFYHQRRSLRHAEQRVSFVNRVSHELRTPLTNIQLNLDLACDSMAEGSPAHRRLGLIREESSRLSRLLENVLTFSTRGRFRSESETNLRPCRVEDAISRALQPFEASMKRLDLRVLRDSRDPALMVLADEDGLIQILGNLFSNVEKYAGTTEAFEIGVSETGGEVCLSISDRGDPIASRDVARMFQPFTRLNHATSEGVSGTGLGLSIARDLAESMGGSLVYACSEQGNVFELRLKPAPANILAIAS